MTKTEESKIALLLEFIAEDKSERETIMQCVKDRHQDAEDLQIVIENIKYGIK